MSAPLNNLVDYATALLLEGVFQPQTDGLNDSVWSIDKEGEEVPHHFVTFYFSRDRAFCHTMKHGGRFSEWDHPVVGDDGGPVTFYLCVWMDYGPAFRAEHDLTLADFATDHWQTLFAIQYPKPRDLSVVVIS